MKRERVIIYGAGDYGRKALALYAQTLDIIAFMDSDPLKTGNMLDNVVVWSPDRLSQASYDRIYVASTHSQEIVNDLIETRGITRNKIYVVPISELHQTSDSKHLAKRFRILSSLLQRNSICHWLDHSSLLGLIRDGNPYQNDIDIAIFSEKALELQALLKSNYKESELAIYTYGFDFTLWNRNDIRQFKLFDELDIHVKVRSERSAYWLVGPMLLRADSQFYNGVELATHESMPLNLPLRPRQYLSNLYGNWEQLAANWTYSDYNNIERTFQRQEMQ